MQKKHLIAMLFWNRYTSERANLLKEFFEPSQDEIERGVKIPTKAHKAIAELVSHGYIKVIVTTNFDRLTEKALENIGIVPIVLSTSDSVEGSLPVVHNNCTILKVNGDYLDTRIRNISSELENYEEPINQLLDRIFDEFGLIICGWSAKWDIALRKAIERCKNHRFTTYWADITDLDGPGKKLAELRRAIFIPIKDADNFFFELSESVLSLENYHRIHPLSLEISVSRLKKYLVDDRYRIELYDLVNNEKEMLHDNISEIYFPINPKQPPTNEEFANRMRKYEDVTQIVLALMINGCYWGKDAYKSIWVSIIERVSTMSDWSGYTNLASLRLYPALILLYGGCIASLTNGNYGTFGSLLTEPVIRDLHEEVPAVMNLNCYKVLDFNIAKQIPLDEMQGKAVPLSNRLYNILKEPFKSFLADDIKYQRTFDKFEYLMALIHADLRKEQGRNPWGPEGCFSWRYRYSSGYNVFDDIESEVNVNGGVKLSNYGGIKLTTYLKSFPQA